VRETELWLYRGAWSEWSADEIDMAVPLSPQEVLRAAGRSSATRPRRTMALFLGDDRREFWQRSEDRSRRLAETYNAWASPNTRRSRPSNDMPRRNSFAICLFSAIAASMAAVAPPTPSLSRSTSCRPRPGQLCPAGRIAVQGDLATASPVEPTCAWAPRSRGPRPDGGPAWGREPAARGAVLRLVDRVRRAGAGKSHPFRGRVVLARRRGRRA
jgi:hypothetical protein